MPRDFLKNIKNNSANTNKSKSPENINNFRNMMRSFK